MLSLLYSPNLTSTRNHWKTIALTIWTFGGKAVSLIFNMLSRFIIVFLPISKCLLISWLQSPCAVILELKKIKSVIVSIVFPSICHAVMGQNAMIFGFWTWSFKPDFPLSSLTFIRTLPNIKHKNKLKMDQRRIFKAGHYETLRGKHRQNTI